MKEDEKIAGVTCLVGSETQSHVAFLSVFQVPRHMWASCCMGRTAGVATGTWMGTEHFTATVWTSSRLPPRTAWEVCGRSECGMTTKVRVGTCCCPSVLSDWHPAALTQLLPPLQGSALPGSCSTSSSGTCRLPAALSFWSTTGCQWRLRLMGAWWKRRCWQQVRPYFPS